jgi:hypothetical protein
MKHHGDSDDEETDDDGFTEPQGEDIPDIDREIRINELKERARELAGGEMSTHTSGELPPEIEEQFWEQVVAFEQGGWSSGLEKLAQIGVDLPPPEDVSDEEMPEKLREVISGMAQLSMYLHHTDHLSDRELYETLWDDLLQEESPEMPGMAGAWIIDPVSSGSDEDNMAYLRYYADEEYRQSWAKDFPEDEIPPHEPLPYDRDSKLPQPPEPNMEMPDDSGDDDEE